MWSKIRLKTLNGEWLALHQIPAGILHALNIYWSVNAALSLVKVNTQPPYPYIFLHYSCTLVWKTCRDRTSYICLHFYIILTLFAYFLACHSCFYIIPNLLCALLKQVFHHSTVIIPGRLVHWSELWCYRGWCVKLIKLNDTMFKMDTSDTTQPRKCSIIKVFLVEENYVPQ